MTKAIQQEDYGCGEIYGQIIQAYPHRRYAIEAYPWNSRAYIKAGQFEAAKPAETLKPNIPTILINMKASIGWHYGSE